MATMKKTELQEELANQDFKRGEELEKRAEQHKNVSFKALLYADAATFYRLSKSYKKAAEVSYKSANCYKEIRKFKDAADMYMNSGRIYWMISNPEAIPCFNQAMDHFVESHYTSLAASHCQEVGYLYEQTRDYECSMTYFLRSADLYSCIPDLRNRDQSKYLAKRVADKLKEINCQKEQKPKPVKVTKNSVSPFTRFEKFLVKCLMGAKHNT